MQPRLMPCLWFADDADAAVDFYLTVFPGRRLRHTAHPGTGKTLTVEFELAGGRMVAMNGGVPLPHADALSLQILCEDQAEIDAYWGGLLRGGGTAVQCGWIKDRWGFGWQILPRQFDELVGSAEPVRARRVLDAMMRMVKIDLAALQAAARR